MPQPPRAMERRIDPSAADAASLVRLGLTAPQPTPSSPPEPPTPAPVPVPRPVPDPVDEAEALQLSMALTEAGITPAVEDQAAVQQLAKLDAETVATVQRWLKKRGKPETPGVSK
ncbi:hypothetical protein [Streptomyces sp. NPDC055642]